MSGTWILVGDSQAVGLEDELREEMAARGWRYLGGFTRVGLGTSAAIAEAARLPAADLAIVVLGGNDTASPALASAIRSLRGQLRVRRVVWVGPFHAVPSEIQARKRAVAQLQAPLLALLGATWIDGFELSIGLEHAPDGVHFTNASHAIAARRIAARIAQPSFAWGWFWAAAAASAAIGGLLWWSRS